MRAVQSLFSLQGKRSVVTGASGGIGRAAAIALASAGADVFLIANRNKEGLLETAQEIERLGRRAWVYQADLEDLEATDQAATDALESLGGVDILVNNAGVIARAAAEDYPIEDWDRVMHVNARAVFRLTQLIGRHMLENGKGKVINIASVLSFQGGIRVPAYAASKGAVAQLTKAFANEWAARGINVNAIAPGYIATENTRPIREDHERYAAILDRIPAGRWGEPQDLDGAVIFLASRASDYMHGHILCVDGGWLAR